MSEPLNFDIPLTQLQTADLIRRVREVEEAYQFKHNLIQESAYASLLKNDRRNLHRACAHALERAYPHALDEHAALLAKHFAEAGDDAKTFEYARRAGDAAFRVHALEEALMHYDTAGLLAARLQISAADVLHLHQQRGRVLEVMGRFEDAIEAYRALEQLGKTRSEPQLEMGALLSLATLFTFPNEAQNLEQAQTVNQAALQLAREIHDQAAEARALWNMQQHAYFSGRAREAVAYSKQALAITDRLNLRELRAYILNDASRALVTIESVPSALNALAEAREIFRAANNLPMLVDNLSTTAETAQVGGELDMAEDFARQAQELSQKIGNLWNLAYSNLSLLSVYALRGEYTQAFAVCDTAVRLAKQSGFYVGAIVAETQRALMYGELGEPARGIQVLEQFQPSENFMMMEAWHAGTFLGLYLLNRQFDAAREALVVAQRMNMDDLSTYGPIFVALGSAKLALHDKRYADAVDATRELVNRLRALQFRFFFPDLLLQQGRAYAGMKEWNLAFDVLREAERVARAMPARPVLWEILAARSELEIRRGNLERARELKHKARAIVEWLAEQAPDDPSPEFGASLRASFLAQEKIRALWDSEL